MPESVPLQVTPGATGMFFAESAHAETFRMEVRREGFHKLLYLQQGCAGLEWAGRPAETAAPGTLWIVPAGGEHRLVDRRPSVIFLLCLAENLPGRDDALREVWPPLARLAGRGLTLGRQAAREVERLWRRALLEQCLARVGGQALVKAEVLRLLAMLARLPPRGAADSAASRIDQLVRQLDDSFFEPWNVDLAAERSGLSRRRFTQLFRQRTGETFVGWLTRLRLHQAERLLLTGRHTVTGAAFAAGFEDLSHFYRLFRQKHRCAPGHWRGIRGRKP